MKRIPLITMMLMLAIMTAGSVSADQQGSLTITEEDSLSDLFELRTVSGGLCQDMADDKGLVDDIYKGQVWCLGPDGSTEGLTGCVVQYSDQDWNVQEEIILDPGEHTESAPDDAVHWKRFNCYDTDYECSNFESAGCGESGDYKTCDDNEMLRVRQCTDNAPSSVETERCVPWNTCYEDTGGCSYEVGDWSPCRDGTQKRIITLSDCSTYTDTQDCTLSCQDPSGSAGETMCSDSDNTKYICDGASGTWKAIGTCGTSTGDDGTSGSDDSDDEPQPNVKANKYASFFSPTKQAIVTKVQLENTGDDMTDTWLIEAQAIPEGGQPFAFVSNQQVCDPEHPENVHKEFLLNSGENKTVELATPLNALPEGPGNYDMYLLTRHKCFNDLTEKEMNNYNDFQRVGPFQDKQKVTTVSAGNNIIPSTESGWMQFLPFALMIAGVVVSLFVPYAGIGLFAGGVVWWMLHLLL